MSSLTLSFIKYMRMLCEFDNDDDNDDNDDDDDDLIMKR